MKAELTRVRAKMSDADEEDNTEPEESNQGGRVEVVVQCAPGLRISDPMLWSAQVESASTTAPLAAAAAASVSDATVVESGDVAAGGVAGGGAGEGGRAGEGTITSEEAEQLLSERVTGLLNEPGAFPVAQLDVVPGQCFWVLRVDVILIQVS